MPAGAAEISVLNREDLLASSFTWLLTWLSTSQFIALRGFISAFTSSYSYVELLAIIQFPKCTTISLRSRPLHISLPFPRISLAVKYMHYAVLIWVWKQLSRGLSVEISPFFYLDPISVTSYHPIALYPSVAKLFKYLSVLFVSVLHHPFFLENT